MDGAEERARRAEGDRAHRNVEMRLDCRAEPIERRRQPRRHKKGQWIVKVGCQPVGFAFPLGLKALG